MADLRKDCCDIPQPEKTHNFEETDVCYECQNCGTQTMAFKNTKEGNEEAISAWNNRLL